MLSFISFEVLLKLERMDLMVSSTHLMKCGSLSGPNITRAIIEIMKSSKKPIENIIGYLYLLL